MKRRRKFIFPSLCTLSLLLCAGTVALWVQSYRAPTDGGPSDMPLRDALGVWHWQSSIDSVPAEDLFLVLGPEVQADWPSLEASGLGRLDPLRVKLGNVEVGDTIWLIVESLNGRAKLVTKDDVVWITGRDGLSEKTRSVDVSREPQGAAAETEFDPAAFRLSKQPPATLERRFGSGRLTVDLANGDFTCWWMPSDPLAAYRYRSPRPKGASRPPPYQLGKGRFLLEHDSSRHQYWKVRFPLWSAVLGFLLFPLMLLLQTVRARWGHTPGTCRNCGYDLRGSSDRCPECGTPIGARSRIQSREPLSPVQ